MRQLPRQPVDDLAAPRFQRQRITLGRGGQRHQHDMREHQPHQRGVHRHADRPHRRAMGNAGGQLRERHQRAPQPRHRRQFRRLGQHAHTAGGERQPPIAPGQMRRLHRLDRAVGDQCGQCGVDLGIAGGLGTGADQPVHVELLHLRGQPGAHRIGIEAAAPTGEQHAQRAHRLTRAGAQQRGQQRAADHDRGGDGIVRSGKRLGGKQGHGRHMRSVLWIHGSGSLGRRVHHVP